MKLDMDIRQLVTGVEGEWVEDSFDNFLMDFESHLETEQDCNFSGNEFLQFQKSC